MLVADEITIQYMHNNDTRYVEFTSKYLYIKVW